MEQISVANITVDIVRKNIKNIHLAVYPPTGRVRIAAPLETNEDTLRLYVISKLNWIKRHQRRFQEQERLSPREYKNRESHYYFGMRYLLHIIEEDLPPKIVLRNKTYIDMHVRPGTSAAKKQEIMNRWYRAELKKKLLPLIKKWEKKLNVKVEHCQIKRMKTKWGSCNIEKRRVWVNLKLAKKPVRCLEYILVHEIVHFFERKHSDSFTARMDSILPNWKSYRKELNKGPLSHETWSY